jgi:NDP-sugar pyrophosphorylase family protein
MQIVIPMAGEARRFRDHGVTTPKPLLDVFGIPLAVRSALSIADHGQNQYIFVALKEHKKWGIESRIMEHIPNSQFIFTDQVTSGPIATCLIAANKIDKNLPVVFNDCDHVFQSSEFNTFLHEQNKNSLNGSALIYFESSDSRFSYVKTKKIGSKEIVQFAAEKKVISNYAVCGVYNFDTVHLFSDIAEKYLANKSKTERFMIEIIDDLARNLYPINAIRAQFHKSLGTPEEYNSAVNDLEFQRFCNEV